MSRQIGYTPSAIAVVFAQRMPRAAFRGLDQLRNQGIGVLLGLCMVIASACDGPTLPPPHVVPPAGSNASAITDADGKATVLLGQARVDCTVSDESGAPLEGAACVVSVGEQAVVVGVTDPLGRFAPIIAIADKTLFDDDPPNAAVRNVHAAGSAILLTLLGRGVIGTSARMVLGAVAVHELITGALSNQILLDDGLLKICLETTVADAVSVLSLAASGILAIFPGVGGPLALAVITGADLFLAAAAETFDVFHADFAIWCKTIIGDENAGIDVLLIATIVLGGVLAESGLVPNTPPSDLYVVQTAADGEDILVGRIQTLSGSTPVITDIAFDGGRLFAVSFTELYEIKRATGEARLVGSLGVPGVNALAFDQAGNLFGASQTPSATLPGSFLSIDIQTGRATTIGSFGSNLESSGDIAFATDGSLFGIGRAPDGQEYLVGIDLASGQATQVSPGTAIGFQNVFGLVFFGDALIGLTSAPGHLISIDLASGIGTRIRDLSFDAFGGGAARQHVGADKTYK